MSPFFNTQDGTFHERPAEVRAQEATQPESPPRSADEPLTADELAEVRRDLRFIAALCGVRPGRVERPAERDAAERETWYSTVTDHIPPDRRT